MVLVVVLTGGLFLWGVVIVAVDFFAQRHQREEAKRRATDTRWVAQEAEWWLRHHR
jgi:transposase